MTNTLLTLTILFCASVSFAAGSKAPKNTAAPANMATQDQGTIKGLVQDDSGKPLPNAVITILETTATGPVKEIAPVTNTKGEFDFTGLPPGEYTLRTTLPGFNAQKTKVKVEGKKTSAVDVMMTKSF